MKYVLNSLQSGDDAEAGLWVSLGYLTPDGEQHVLHIVGVQRREVADGDELVATYFERDDQSLSGYDAADKILIDENSIRLTLNKSGQEHLQLPKTLIFEIDNLKQNFRQARTAFKKMQKRRSGEKIHVV